MRTFIWVMAVCLALLVWLPGSASAVVTTQPSVLEGLTRILGVPTTSALHRELVEQTIAAARKEPSKMDAPLGKLAEAYHAGADWPRLAADHVTQTWGRKDAEVSEWKERYGSPAEWHQVAVYLLARAKREEVKEHDLATRDVQLALLVTTQHGGLAGLSVLLTGIPKTGIAGFTKDQLAATELLASDLTRANRQFVFDGRFKVAQELDRCLAERPLKSGTVSRVLAQVDQARQFAADLNTHRPLISYCGELLARVREDGDAECQAAVADYLAKWRKDDGNPVIRQWLDYTLATQVLPRRSPYVDDMRLTSPTTTARPATRPSTSPTQVP